MQLAIARVCKDITLDPNPVGTSSGASMNRQSLASHLTYEMCPPLQISVEHPQMHPVLPENSELVTVVPPSEGKEGSMCSGNNIGELDEIELQDPPHETPRWWTFKESVNSQSFAYPLLYPLRKISVSGKQLPHITGTMQFCYFLINEM